MTYQPQPLAGPFYAPPYGPAWTCEGFRRLSVVCELPSTEVLEELLANTPFEAAGTRFEAFIDDLSGHSLGSFNESGVAIPVRYGDVKGIFHTVMFVGSDVALIAGREVFGYPKLLGETVLSNDGRTWSGVTTRNGVVVLDIRLELTAEPIDPAAIERLAPGPGDGWEWSHHLSVKSIPSPIKGRADVLDVIYRNIAGVIKSATPGAADVTWGDAAEVSLFRGSRVVAGYLLEGDFGGGWSEDRRILSSHR